MSSIFTAVLGVQYIHCSPGCPVYSLQSWVSSIFQRITLCESRCIQIELFFIYRSHIHIHIPFTPSYTSQFTPATIHLSNMHHHYHHHHHHYHHPLNWLRHSARSIFTIAYMSPYLYTYDKNYYSIFRELTATQTSHVTIQHLNVHSNPTLF